MAGLGFKTFAVGDVLTAADVNGYLMQQAVLRFDDSGARGSAIGTATEGMLSYLADTDAVEVYNGSAWTSIGLPLGTATPAEGDTLTYGTATSTWNPSPAGKVLQVVQTVKTDTFSSASSSYTDVTGLAVSITPSSTASKVLVVVNLMASLPGGAGMLFATLLRDATSLVNPDSPSNRTPAYASINLGGIANSVGQYWPLVFVYLDSPATTSALDYQVQIAQPSSVTMYVNRSSNDSDIAGYPRGVSTITAMEIAA